MTAPRTLNLAQVLARIEAPALPDASALADIPLDELERQLAALGVDVDGEMGELLSAAGAAPGPVPLEQLVASDLDGLSLDEVEARLRSEGVDVAGYLSRALTLIRGRTPAEREASASRRGRRAAPHDAGTRAARRPRRLPRAVAASVIAVALGGVVFTMVHEQGVLTVPTQEQGDASLRSPSVADHDDALATSSAMDRVAAESDPGDGPRLRVEDEQGSRASLESEARVVAEAGSTRGGPVARGVAKPTAKAPSAEATPSLEVADKRDDAARSAVREVISGARVPALARANGAHPAEAGKEASPPGGMGQGRAGSVVGTAAREEKMAQRQEAAGAQPPAAASVSVVLAPGQTLEQALAPVAMARADREALLALLSAEAVNAAGRLRLELDGERVLSAALERGAAETVRVLRSATGALRRSP